MDRKGQLSSWSEVMEDVQKRFGEGAYVVLAGRLSKLVQTESVKDYQSQI